MEVQVRWRKLASVPLSTVRPPRMMLTRSQSASTSARMWLESSTVRPPALLGDALAEHRSYQGIEARTGFIQDQQLDVGGERGDQRDLLPIALGVVAALDSWIESETLEETLAVARIEAAAQSAEQVDDLAARQAWPQRHVAGNVGEAAMQCDGVAPADRRRGSERGRRRRESGRAGCGW